MKTMIALSLLTAAGLLAQPPGPPPGRGFGPGRGGFAGGPERDINHPVTGAPYSAVETTTETQILPDGNTIQRQRNTNVARDSQGRFRTETTETRRGPGASAQSGTPVTRVTISDPVARVVRTLDSQTKTAHEMAVHAPPAGRGSRPNFNPGNRNPANRPTDPNVKTESLGTQVVNGETATGTRITRTIPAGAEGNARAIQSVRETWISTDLKVPVMIKTSDPRHGTTVIQLTNISHVEPDATLFQTPSDYTVRTGPGRSGPRGQNRN